MRRAINSGWRAGRSFRCAAAGCPKTSRSAMASTKPTALNRCARRANCLRPKQSSKVAPPWQPICHYQPCSRRRSWPSPSRSSVSPLCRSRSAPTPCVSSTRKACGNETFRALAGTRSALCGSNSNGQTGSFRRDAAPSGWLASIGPEARHSAAQSDGAARRRISGRKLTGRLSACVNVFQGDPA